MNNVLSIRPSRDLRNNYAKLSEMSRQNPVAITVNGREDTVLMSHESYAGQQNYIAELEARLAVYAHLAQAEDDIRLGRVQDMDECLDELLEELNKAEI